MRCEDVIFETSLQDSEAEARYELRFKTLDGALINRRGGGDNFICGNKFWR